MRVTCIVLRCVREDVQGKGKKWSGKRLNEWPSSGLWCRRWSRGGSLSCAPALLLQTRHLLGRHAGALHEVGHRVLELVDSLCHRVNCKSRVERVEHRQKSCEVLRHMSEYVCVECRTQTATENGTGHLLELALHLLQHLRDEKRHLVSLGVAHRGSFSCSSRCVLCWGRRVFLLAHFTQRENTKKKAVSPSKARGEKTKPSFLFIVLRV